MQEFIPKIYPYSLTSQVSSLAEFHVRFWCVQSFSAVVGPNGSGKSNVIDAMLFVFGKRAKQVRKSCLFKKKHTAVVYVDALEHICSCNLFIFHLKQMLLNKVAELIHNSSNHQNLDKARVSVHFQEIIDLVWHYKYALILISSEKMMNLYPILNRMMEITRLFQVRISL